MQKLKPMKTTTQSPASMTFGCPHWRTLRFAQFTAIALAAVTAFAQTEEAKPSDDQGKKPNILVIMGDDIGWFNPSCYHSGIMGYQTPNIDRIAKARASRTGMGSKAAPPAARRSSPVSRQSARG
jgi:hypothetical protein